MNSSPNFKIIIDANVIISAIIFGGNPEKVLDFIIETPNILYISQKLIDEVFRILEDKFNFSVREKIKLKMIFEQKAIKIQPQIQINICKDPKDNYLLELAETCQADYLITGDKDLLEIGNWKNTKIIKPKDFIEII